MTVTSTRKALEYFDNKLEFTTGPVELKHWIDSGENINVIDVRAAEDYETGRIPGAVSLPEDQWTTFEGLGRDRINVIYCYSHVCHLATRAARYFAEHDFPVMELDGGIEEWKANGLPVEI